MFYTTVGAVAAVGLVSWPTAALFGGVHALLNAFEMSFRAGAVGEARAGLLEAVDDIA
jgi:hypothetical protein